MKFALVAILTLFSQLGFADLAIYSDRDPAWFDTAKAQFEQQTGEDLIIVRVDHKELIQRILLENQAGGTPADLVFSKDLLYFTELKRRGLLSPLPSVAAFSEIPAGMIADDQSWAAFTFRARAAVYNPAETSADEITSYQDLADSKWKGKLCLRQGTSFYNIAMVSSLALQNGQQATEDMVKSWVENLAADIFPNDRSLISAVNEKTCKVGLVNHYYLAQELVKNPDLSVAFKFLNQEQGGVHTNGTAVARLAKAEDKSELIAVFLNALYSPASLQAISAAHFDYPASTTVVPETFIGSWGPNQDGEFLIQGLDWDAIGSGQARRNAVEIITKAGWE
jgi:iron(III) transport system substrate-binding protein